MKKLFVPAILATSLFAACHFDENKNDRNSNNTNSFSSTSAATDKVEGNTKTFANKDFSEIEINSAFHVTLVQGSNYEIIANGNAADLEKIEVKQNGKDLTIGLKNNSGNVDEIQLHITLPRLEDLDLTGAVIATASSEFNAANELSIDVSGASKLTMPVKANKVSVDISGAGQVTLTGNTNILNLDASGNGIADLLNLTAKNADIEISGASDAKVHVTNTIEAEASGASSLQYKGNPRVRKAQTSGASEITGI